MRSTTVAEIATVLYELVAAWTGSRRVAAIVIRTALGTKKSPSEAIPTRQQAHSRTAETIAAAR